MPAAREHVHGLDGLDGEAAGGQELHVPSQGGGVAGDVDHALCARGKDGFEYFFLDQKLPSSEI